MADFAGPGPDSVPAVILRRNGEALFGSQWQTELAKALSTQRGRKLDPAILRGWNAGSRSIPPWVFHAITRIAEERKAGIDRAITKIDHHGLRGRTTAELKGKTDMSDNAKWQVHAIAGEHVIWHDGEVFQASREEVPDGVGGYKILDSLLQLKNIHPGNVIPVPEAERDVHVVSAPKHDGKPTWHGLYRTDDGWQVASSDAGPIAYADPAAARVGAKVCREEALERPVPGPR